MHMRAVRSRKPLCGPSRAKEKCAQCMFAPVEHYENPAVIVRRAWGRAPVPVYIRGTRGKAEDRGDNDRNHDDDANADEHADGDYYQSRARVQNVKARGSKDAAPSLPPTRTREVKSAWGEAQDVLQPGTGREWDEAHEAATLSTSSSSLSIEDF